MTSSFIQTQKAGVRLRPACSSLIFFLLLGSVASAQENKEFRAINSILGVSVGSSLEETRAKLTSLGTGGGRDTRDGGRKEAWTLKDTEYGTLAFKTDSKGKVMWVSAFARPGKEIPFSQLGNLSKAARAADSQAIWNVETPQGGYRLVAKGVNGKASVVYLLSLAFPEIN